MRIWGEHAMVGTPGADVIPQLQPVEGEIVSPKRVYGGFEGTGWTSSSRHAASTRS